MELRHTYHWRGRTVAWGKRGSGPALVMCHGTPWSSRLWESFAVALSRQFTVYLWDMPGYGQSSKDPHHAVDLGVQGELFADLLRHWELDSPRVVAHDYGGAVSLRALLLHDAEYHSLALVDAVALAPWGSDFFRLVADTPEVFAAQPLSIHKGALESYIATASHRGLTVSQMDTLTSPWLTSQGQPAFYRQIAAADQHYTDDIQSRYGEIDLPVRVIWGREDSWVPVDRARRLAELIPHATVDIIADAGHLIQYDTPVELAISLQRWLTEPLAK